MSRFHLAMSGLLATSILGGFAGVSPAEAQSRIFGGGYRGPAPSAGAFRAPGPAYGGYRGGTYYGGGYRPYYGGWGWRAPYYGWRAPYWGWAGVGLGLGLGFGLPWYAYPPAYYGPSYSYYPYPQAYPVPGYPVGIVKPEIPGAGTPVSPWLPPSATAWQCRAGPVTCFLPVPLDPGTLCSCPGGRGGEIAGRAQ